MFFSSIIFLIGLVLAMGAANMKREEKKTGTPSKESGTLMLIGVVLIVVAVITRMQ